MVLKLNNKTYTPKKVKAVMIREAFELLDEVKERVNLEKLDKMMSFVVRVYDGQFTEDDIYNGLEAESLYPMLYRTIVDLTNGMASKFESKNAQPEAVEKN